ncbi:MAG TPA: protein-disulfide reductase DsbD domain-containing protein [Candidatus Acidoferrales bacterium]|nr:protein-disulfide reductase DsbD domain-containing protein [Candidatus Acidoferrales bacterium]
MPSPSVNSRFLALRVLVLISLACMRVSAASIPHGTVELVAEDQWIAPGHESYFGLHFQLEKGWHVYWLNPGDSGQPLHAEWHLPKGLTAGEIEWPAPRRLGTSTIIDYGYESEVTLLVPVRGAASLQLNQPAQLDAELAVLVCREICVPGKTHVSLSLPIHSMPPEPDGRNRGLFAAARKSLPRAAPPDWTVRAVDADDTFILVVKSNGREIRGASFFPLKESQLDNSAPQKLERTAAGFRLTLRKSDQLLKPIQRLTGVLELPANENYVIDAPVQNAGAGRQAQ